MGERQRDCFLVLWCALFGSNDPAKRGVQYIERNEEAREGMQLYFRFHISRLLIQYETKIRAVQIDRLYSPSDCGLDDFDYLKYSLLHF